MLSLSCCNTFYSRAGSHAAEPAVTGELLYGNNHGKKSPPKASLAKANASFPLHKATSVTPAPSGG